MKNPERKNKKERRAAPKLSFLKSLQVDFKYFCLIFCLVTLIMVIYLFIFLKLESLSEFIKDLRKDIEKFSISPKWKNFRFSNLAL